MPNTTLPFEPLERLIPHVAEPHMRVREVAAALGISKRQVWRYRSGGVSERAADRLACHLGLAPTLIEGWPDE
jgi:hypothetical protein